MHEKLKNLSDQNYRTWYMRIVNDDTISYYGVRMPSLHKIADQVARQDWQKFLATNTWRSHEERMIACLIPQYIRPELTAQELFEYFNNVAPYLSNWALTDALAKKYLQIYTNPLLSWQKIDKMIHSPNIWICRLGIVLILNNFAKDLSYSDLIIQKLLAIETREYYIKMAIAWCLSELAVISLEKVVLSLINFDPEITKMTKQKMRDSHRVAYF